MIINIPETRSDYIENLIPQKKPFVMVGELLNYNEESLQSGFIITDDNIFTQDGVFQASGIIEHQAQSVALHTGYQFYLKNEEPPVGYIGAIKSCEINFLPKSNDRIITSVDIMNELMGVTLVKVTTRLGDIVVATSEMKTVIK